MSEAKDHAQESAHEKHKPKESKLGRYSIKRLLISVPLLFLVVLLAASGYVYAVSPQHIRSPKMEHLHFRMQIVVDGQAVDFSKPVFQKEYAKGQCSGELAADPIHFHDNKDQFVHIHWAKMTGGLVLKTYGWNFIGGNSTILGYRLDELPRVTSVPIHGKDLPALPDQTSYWVYSGDENSYQKRSFDDFKQQDLETFFDTKSNFMTMAPKNNSLIDALFPKASAHGSETHVHEEERLTRLNNLIGNVVIFVQKQEPSTDQITARFADLEPLSDSTCGG